ncbi:MAG: diguanylate cyclase, partial [Candidatus Omnitrophica bacterium]|nr:diguanylate cyclase [Candidatus Omnitrophota bacterium]
MDNKDYKRKPSRIKSSNLSSLFLDNYVDQLTKAYNRSFLFHFLPEILNNAQKKDYSVALFIVDLDDFKHINDTYGHLGGDRVLKDVAASLKFPLRENDYLIRYAGDEFLIILEDVVLKSASIVGKRIIDSVRALKIKFKDKIITQTVSMGFSLFPDDAKDLESLIERADEALYLVKKRDKNEFVYYREVNISQISLKVGMNSFPCSEFVGRENEISIIEKNIKEVQDASDIRGVMVFGESGVGKSRLLKELACIAQEIGFDQISFIPFQKESLKEYALLTKSFNLYLMNNIVHNKEKIFEILNCMDSETIKILVYFIPCLKDYFPQVVNKPENSVEIFEAFSVLMEKIAQQKGGLVLTFDNVHYADLKTLEFCNFILESNKKSKLFFYMNTLDLIPAGIFNPSAIAQFIKRIISNEKIEAINLGFLSKEYTSKIVGTIFPGVEKDLKFCQIIYDITKGQP